MKSRSKPVSLVSMFCSVGNANVASAEDGTRLHTQTSEFGVMAADRSKHHIVGAYAICSIHSWDLSSARLKQVSANTDGEFQTRLGAERGNTH